MNKLILIGRLGQEPEVKYLSNDNPVANFSLATSERYKDKEGNKAETTHWHKVVAWKHLAQLCEKYVHKGDLLCVVGKVTYRSYEDKDGVKKYITEIVASEIELLGGKKNSSEGEPAKQEPDAIEQYMNNKPEETVEEGDLPF